MGMFDDLIPNAGSTGGKPATAPAGGMFDDLIPKEQPAPAGEAFSLATPANAQAPAAPAGQSAEPSMWDGVKSAVSGSDRTEFPDAPEFRKVVGAGVRNDYASAAEMAADPNYQATKAAYASTVAVTPQGQIDILKKHIPGLEVKKDRFGNDMLRRPGEDWAYLNKPGLSARDAEEFATSTIMTAPAMIATGGASLLGRLALGAATMAGSSVAQDVAAGAAGSKQGVDPVRAGVSGAIGGALAPGVPSAVAGGVRDAAEYVTAPIVGRVRGAINPQGQATRTFDAAMDADIAHRLAATRTPEEAAIHQKMGDLFKQGRAGDELRHMDVGGENVRALARSAANTSPEARETINEVVTPRFQTQAARTVDFLQSLTRTPANAGATRDQLERTAKAANGPAYRAAYAAGDREIWSPTLERIAGSPAVVDAMSGAVTSGKNRAIAEGHGAFNPGVIVENGMIQFKKGKTGVPAYPNLQFWDYTKRELDGMAGKAARAGDKEAAGVYQTLSRQLREELDTIVPEFGKARGQAKQFFQADSALEAGENFVAGRFQNHEARKAVKAMSATEQVLFREGFVSRFVQTLNETGDRRNILNSIAHSPAARERMEIALGPNGARELEAFLRIEGLMDAIRPAVQGNSTTARQLAEIGLAGGVGGLVSGFNPNDPAGWLAGALAGIGARRANVRIDQNVARHVAQMLVATDDAVFRRGVQAAAHSPILRALREIDLPQPVRAVTGRQMVPSQDDEGQR